MKIFLSHTCSNLFGRFSFSNTNVSSLSKWIPFLQNHFYFDSEVNCFNSVVFLKGGVGMPLMKGGIPWFFQLFFSFHSYIQSSFHDYILELASLNLFFLNVLKMKKHWKKICFKLQFRLRLHWRKNFQTKNWKKKFCQIFFPQAHFLQALDQNWRTLFLNKMPKYRYLGFIDFFKRPKSIKPVSCVPQ